MCSADNKVRLLKNGHFSIAVWFEGAVFHYLVRRTQEGLLIHLHNQAPIIEPTMLVMNRFFRTLLFETGLPFQIAETLDLVVQDLMLALDKRSQREEGGLPLRFAVRRTQGGFQPGYMLTMATCTLLSSPIPTAVDLEERYSGPSPAASVARPVPSDPGEILEGSSLCLKRGEYGRHRSGTTTTAHTRTRARAEDAILF